MCKRVLPVFSLLCGIVVHFAASSARPETVERATDAPSVTLRTCLQRAGEQYQRKFTFEYVSEIAKHGAPTSQASRATLPDRIVKVPPNLDRPEALVDHLKKELPDVVFDVDSTYGNVIHVISRQLKNDGEYALNRTITIKYSGSRHDLPNAIQKQVRNIRAENVFAIGEIDADATPIRCDVAQMRVRDVLTAVVPAEQHGVVWMARTDYGADVAETVVTSIPIRKQQ